MSATPAQGNDADTVVLRLYCHGLGDCHLIGLPATGGVRKWLMIDCGVHTAMPAGAARVESVVKDIAAVTGSTLDVVIGTHEHWDHNSGFDPRRNFFRDFTVHDVWLGWTENPADPQGRQLDRYKGDAFATVTEGRRRLAEDPRMSALSDGLTALSGFSGASDLGAAAGGSLSRAARDALATRSGKTPRYLEPGDVVEIEAVDAIRCYVLAPPRDQALLGLVDSAAHTYSGGLSKRPAIDALSNAMEVNAGRLSLDQDFASPFDAFEGMPLGDARRSEDFLKAHYLNDETRMIDNDWLLSTADLALQLDNRTNNTSLVLAFEIVASGHVLLFAADAQVGNWKSWAEVCFPAAPGRPATTGAALLARTTFYKVGHHGSRNATLREGLEAMVSLEVAFNPTDEKMAKSVRWADIPAAALNAELARRTNGRLIQSDTPWVTDPGQSIPITAGGSLRAIARAPGPSIECWFL